MTSPTTYTKVIQAKGGGRAGTLTLRLHPHHASNGVHDSHITAKIEIQSVNTAVKNHMWTIPRVPAGGWPLYAAQTTELEREFEKILTQFQLAHIEDSINALLQLFMANNAMSRRHTITYQRKRLRERFGPVHMTTSFTGVAAFPPFPLVWERPMRGGLNAAVRGLVTTKGGKTALEQILDQVNRKGIKHTLSAQDVADQLLRVEGNLLSLGVRSDMLVGTQVTISPRMPSASKYWLKSKGGTSYTNATLHRMEAGCWGLATSNRAVTKAPVKQVLLTLPFIASVASLLGHMQARDIHLVHQTNWRLMTALNEWRELQESKQNAVPTRLDAIPTATSGERDPAFNHIRSELVDLINQDDLLAQDLDALREPPF